MTTPPTRNFAPLMDDDDHIANLQLDCRMWRSVAIALAAQLRLRKNLGHSDKQVLKRFDDANSGDEPITP